MSLRRRLLRILLITLGVVAFTGFFAFRTMLFDPFEAKYGFDISTLVPRDVDVFVAKADLAQDFDPFPVPVVAAAFGASESAQALAGQDLWKTTVGAIDLDGIRADIATALAQSPIQVDPLAVLGGEDLGLALRLGVPGTDPAWAIYARTNWVGKLGFALLSFPDALGLPDQGMAVAENDGVFSLAGGGLSTAVHIARVKDVMIVASLPEFPRAALDLEASLGRDSLGQSAKYNDHVTMIDREGNEAELVLDLPKFLKNQGLGGAMPDPGSENWGTAMLGRLFQVASVRELLGIVGVEGGVSMRLHGMLASERINSRQRRLYRTRGFDRTEFIEDVAKYAPADAGVVAYLRADLGDLLRDALDSAEPALVSNLADLVRTVWTYPDCQQLIDDLDAAFKGRIAVIVRENDYPDEGLQGPPHDETPVPVWAIVLWVEDRARIEAITTRIQSRQSEFTIQGREPGSRGVFQNTVRGGHRAYEYWSPFIPGTGHVATVLAGNVFLISNEHQMLGHLLKTFYDGSPGDPRLAEDPIFESMVYAGLNSADAAVWWNPRSMGQTLRRMAQRQAEDNVVINWVIERPRIDRLVLKEQFPGETWGRLSPSVQSQLEMVAGPRRNAFAEEFRAQHVPVLYAEYEQRLLAAEIVRAGLLEVSIDPKRLDIHAQALIPLGD